MKKILLSTSFLISLLSLKAAAQGSFKLSMDTAREAYSGRGIELHNDIKNLSSGNIKVSWKVIASSSDFPKSWLDATGLCDNGNCYNNGSNESFTNGMVFTTENIAPNATGSYDLQLADMSTLPNGNHHLTVQMTNGSTQKLCVFNVSKSATGISASLRSDNEVLMFPIPAHNELNVNFTSSLNVRSAMLYNLIGKVIISRRISENSTQFDLSNLPAGVYFVRLADAQGNVVATRRFTHQ